MDLTAAIIRLWRLCVPAGAGPEAGGDGAVHVEVFRDVLERELMDKVEALSCSSVDDILERYLQPDQAGTVGFLEFWRGMEQILQACDVPGIHSAGAKRQVLDAFRFLRTCILNLAPEDSTGDRAEFTVSELRFFIIKAQGVGGPDGHHAQRFWDFPLSNLPNDDECVTGEEVASAVLTWLEMLMELSEYPDGTLQSPFTLPMANQALLQEQVTDLDDSADEGTNLEPDVYPAVTTSERVQPEPPRGPPPKRSVAGTRTSVASVASPGSTVNSSVLSDAAARQQQLHQQQQPQQQRLPATRWQPQSPNSSRQLSELEQGLVTMLQRPSTRPAELTKALAAEWRETIEFEVALRHCLSAKARTSMRPLLFADFFDFCTRHVRSAARRVSRGASPKPAVKTALATYSTGVRALFAVLNSLLQKQRAAGFSALVRSRRMTTTRNIDATGAESHDFDIMRELYGSQAAAQVELEHRLALTGQAGGLAWCLSRLHRGRALREPFFTWQRAVARSAEQEFEASREKFQGAGRSPTGMVGMRPRGGTDRARGNAAQPQLGARTPTSAGHRPQAGTLLFQAPARTVSSDK
mmetsp:Transcript_51238/g.120090  ORF Transcript_51238/g.120090 Transcript_51238/m.120090 type:complete len:582 (-) Transcript_51238:19-1764(-)